MVTQSETAGMTVEHIAREAEKRLTMYYGSPAQTIS